MSLIGLILAFVLAVFGFTTQNQDGTYHREADGVVTGPHGWEGPPPQIGPPGPYPPDITSW